MSESIHVLAISGSLRKLSSNTAILRAASELAPSNVHIQVLEGLEALPMFNPDMEGCEPKPVLRLRQQMQEAQAYMIASPEYAHGVSGPLKNALDWVVGSGEMTDKPISFLNASTRTSQAYDALAETLTVMGGKLVPSASLVVPLANNRLNCSQILDIPEYASIIKLAITELVLALQNRPT